MPCMAQYLSDNTKNILKRAFKCIFPGLGYPEILRCVNLDTLKVRRGSLCPKKYKIKVPTHRTNIEQMDTVTPLYRGNYTTASIHGTAEYNRLIPYHKLL